MKILHIYKTYFPDTMGGVEYVIQSLTQHTGAVGCRNTLLTTSPVNREISRPANLTVHHYRQLGTVASCPISYSFWRDLKSKVNDADIIHYHFPWPFADFSHFTLNLKKPYLVTYHSDIVKQRLLKFAYFPLMNKFLKNAHSIVATSSNYLESSPILQRYSNKVSIIPLGISPKNYPTPSADRLAQWQQKLEAGFILFIGVLRYYKGLQYLIEAARLIPEIPIVIAGSGPMEQQLKILAKKLDCRNVIFVGTVTEQDKAALLHLCLGFVLPSHLRSEAFGVSLIEALLFKKPLISTDLGTGTSFVNLDQVTGYVVPPANSTALAAAMRSLHRMPEKTKEMGEAAFKRFETLFTADKMATAYIKIYQSILESRAC